MNDAANLLARFRTIVVVGASSNPTKPAHYVPAYMQAQGYRIIPVNPLETEVLGERSYPDLASVPEPVEFVNVFRRAEACPEVAGEAVAAGAKLLWLQLGIRSTEAKRIARRAGMDYVEDRCLMVEHRMSGVGRMR